MRRILFISHEASRTGAPILLLRLIEQIKKYAVVEIFILVKEGGELEKDFVALGNTFVWNRTFPESFLHKSSRRVFKLFGLHQESTTEKYRAGILKEISHVDIIFSNTVANAGLLKELPLSGKKIFSYLHELDVVTEMVSTREEVHYLNTVSEKIFVPAKAVKDFLHKQYDIPLSKIEYLQYIIPIQNNKLKKDKDNSILTSLIEDGKFLVGFCGVLDWRKGCEFLPLIANKIINEKKISDIHFVWLGANTSFYDYLILKNDLVKLQLETHCTFIESLPNIQQYLSKLDVLALPSREDAFPLVVLEAAGAGVPCVYFLQAGGIVEFCGTDAGIPINYLDIDKMSDAIIVLKLDADLKIKLGQRAKEKLAEYSKPELIIRGLLSHF